MFLDAELAVLYGVTTRRLNEQVRRNRKRFPDDFLFELTSEELATLKSHFQAVSQPVGTNDRAIHHQWPCTATTGGEKTGAGDGNRTHVSSLGSCSSTIELHPRGLLILFCVNYFGNDPRPALAVVPTIAGFRRRLCRASSSTG